MVSSLRNVTFDCADALVLAGFWSTLLDEPIDDGATSAMATIGMSAKDRVGPAWAFLQVPEGKVAKNRCHPDLAVGDEEECAQLVAKAVDAGATVVGPHDEGGLRWTTLTDPEGNELCVV